MATESYTTTWDVTPVDRSVQYSRTGIAPPR